MTPTAGGRGRGPKMMINWILFVEFKKRKKSKFTTGLPSFKFFF
jgi:hypothetical protein